MIRKTALALISFFWIASSLAQTANFSASVTSGCSPLVVSFQDQSTGAASWFWDFGNGATATLQNPSTTYFTPGTYTVSLTVKNGQNSNTLTKTQYITVYGKPAMNFTVNDSTACFPHRAQFTDLSIPSPGTVNSSWLWDFGDGNQSSQQNPSHTYTSSGNYTVTLKVNNNKGCYGVVNKTAYIKIAGGVHADFTNSQPNVCRPPFNISFTNNGTGPGGLTWFWNFGDGNTSTQQNPVHSYTAPGNYQITYVITSNVGCSDTLKKDTALNILNINTAFTAPDSICVNAAGNFINTSTPAPKNSSWTFGDGSTSTQTNPVKIFSTVGTYNVQLVNTYSYCSDTYFKPVKVLPRPTAGFVADVTSKCQPNLDVKFTDQSANAVSWFWNFGDGGTSSAQSPAHTYTNYGSFDVVLVVTNNLGCTDTLKKPAYIKVKRPVITFPGLPIEGCIPYTLNAAASISTLDAVTSYLWNFGDGTTSTNANPSHTYSLQNGYNVSLTITTSSGCTESYTLPVAVKVGEKPTVNFAASPNPVCAFQGVQFTDLSDKGDHWLWTFGDGGISTDQHPTHQYADTGRFTISLFVKNSGCTDSLIIPNYIRIKPPVARFGFNTTCLNRLQFSFLDSSIGALSWKWDFGDGSPTETIPNPVHFFPAFGIYSVSLTVTNDTCSHTLTRQIRVFNENPDITAAVRTACKPVPLGFAAVSGSLQNIVDYEWDFGNGQTPPHTATPFATSFYPSAGLFQVSLITTDMYGCKDTVVKPNFIRINGATANFNATNISGCRGLTSSFTDASTNDGTNAVVTWKYNFGDGTPPKLYFTGPFQHTYNDTGVYSVKLIITDAAGCVDSITRANLVTITAPKADFGANDTASCPGASVQFTNHSSTFNFNVWDFGDGHSFVGVNAFNTYANPGFYTVKLTVTDQFGCSDSMIRPNFIHISKPTASFSMSDSISACVPFGVVFTNTSDYYIGNIWDLGGGVSTLSQPVQFYNSPGNYPIKLVVISWGGCRDSAFGTVRIFDTTGSKINYLPLDGCKPLSVDISSNGPDHMNYTWDFGDGVLVNNDSTGINHIYNFFGNFTPKLIMTDHAGCVVAITGRDTIHIKGATVKFGYDKGFYCDSGMVRFTDSTQYNDSLSVYNWDFGDGGSSHIRNPSHYFTTPGLYNVSLGVLTQNACVDTFRLTEPIRIIQSPLISIGGDSVICVNDFVDHLGVFERPDTSTVKWSWHFADGNTSSLQNPAPQQYKAAGDFIVRTSAVNSSGCKDSTTKNIHVNPLPTVTLPSLMTMQVGFPVTIPATYTSNVVSYLWSPSTTLNCTDCPQPVASPKATTKYSVTFVDSNGCKNVGNVQVVVICKNANVFIPNTFSPNGDGSNDKFYVRGRGLDRVKSLRIFNRWGEVVFEQTNFPVNDPVYGWDGKYKGHEAVPDVYVYQVEVFCDNSQIIRLDGNVALIK